MDTFELINHWTRQYGVWKYEISQATGASESLLHVHIGLALFIASALVFRRQLRSPLPLFIVLLFAVLNEAIDYLGGFEAPPGEPIIDIANTLFWPAILFVIARRKLFARE
ncbi:hypothetical protein [Sphingomicrobium flavum]|uniref:hypothetical protein n=1 Tax=Sphingomicrobium flavum TaxID=1229164 RepID=UPI0021AE127D|nr:hypothetical protein [Sphingomicrobium flavum]